MNKIINLILNQKSKFFLVCVFLIVNFASNLFAQELFVIAKGNSKLLKLDKNTPGQASILIDPQEILHGLTIDPESGDIYYTDRTNNSSGNIIRVNRDGTNPTVVASGLNMPKNLALNHVTDTLFFTALDPMSFPSIYSVPTSGGNQNINLILSGDPSQGPVDIDVDTTNNVLYWTDDRGPSIRRIPVIDGMEETMVNNISSTLSGISVDSSNGFVYWINESSTAIQYFGVGASAPTNPLFAVTDSLIGRGGLQVDGTQNPTEFFIATSSNQQILKATFNGSAQVLLTLAQGASSPSDIVHYNIIQPTPTPTPVPPVATATVTSTPTPVDDPILRPTTQIVSPPTVGFKGKKVTITLKSFTSAINVDQAVLFRDFEALAASKKLQIRYNVQVTAPKKRDNKKLLSKRNTLTLKNLRPGNYSVKYSASAFSKKSKKQITKAKDKGKTGFTASFKKVYTTNTSPTAAFTIQ